MGDVSDNLFDEQLAMIQRKFLARALGVRNRAPADWVQAEAVVAPLTLRRDTATLAYHARVVGREGRHSVKGLFRLLDRDGSERFINGRRSSVHERARLLRGLLTPGERAAGTRGFAAIEGRRWQAVWSARRRDATTRHSYRELRRTVPPRTSSAASM